MRGADAAVECICMRLDTGPAPQVVLRHPCALAAKGQAALTREEKLARQRSLDNLGLQSFGRMCQVRRRGCRCIVLLTQCRGEAHGSSLKG